MGNENESKQVWWGSFRLADGQAGRWLVGPMTMWIFHDPHEWRIYTFQEHDPLVDAAGLTLPVDAAEAEAFLEVEDPIFSVSRFSFRQTDETLSVQPALADREVVVRPETPLYILAGEAVTLYVSTPLWMRLDVGAPLRLLQEIPTYRPSDTWFGPSTREGELCYASRSSGCLKLEDLPLRLHRAVTPVFIHNRAGDALLLDRLKLPVQYLSLYRAANNFLWTQAVTLHREASGDLAALRLGEQAPPEAVDATLLRGPRQESKPNVIVRTFGSLLQRG